MKRKQLKVLGLSYSHSQTGSYVVVLAEKKGDRKVPIIVKPNDAQNIALKIEGIKSKRPATHDLFKSLTDSFEIDIQEVYIYALLEGVFYAKAIITNGLDEVGLECSVGDALALALTYKCPIWMKSDVLESAGIMVGKDEIGEATEEDEESSDFEEDAPAAGMLSVEDLQRMMDEAIRNEEYEVAAQLRDRIAKLGGE